MWYQARFSLNVKDNTKAVLAINTDKTNRMDIIVEEAINQFSTIN